MRFDSLPLALTLLIGAHDALAAPRAPRALHVPLVRRAAAERTAEEWGLWAKEQKNVLEGKYSGDAARKRAEGMNLIVNQNADSSYYGSLAIGTPATAYNVILDTGSSDLWLADSACTTGCDQITTFNPDSSSSFKNLSTSFSITYGSGQAAGVLGTDVVQMAGFEVNEQVIGVCSVVSSGLLNEPVSGLLGLAWQSIASSGATPFWENLYQNNAWDQPLMAFQLTRYQNDSRAAALEPGGTFTMGNVNSSLYTGDIDFQDIPTSTPTYWTLPLKTLIVNGNSITLASGSSSYAAIDTGTTLIGGPTDQVAAIFAQIPNSAAGTGNYQGYYLYPCDTTVSVTLSFGGKDWSISPADFQLAQVSSSQCLGAFFEFSSSSSAPSWIIGDTFLKNVYSVFRVSPASIGFAALSETAVAMNGASGTISSPTIGSVSASVTGSGRSASAGQSIVMERGARAAVFLSALMSAAVGVLVL